jgi:hypothetical protein
VQNFDFLTSPFEGETIIMADSNTLCEYGSSSSSFFLLGIKIYASSKLKSGAHDFLDINFQSSP